jgi:hypothetical protein
MAAKSGLTHKTTTKSVLDLVNLYENDNATLMCRKHNSAKGDRRRRG